MSNYIVKFYIIGLRPDEKIEEEMTFEDLWITPKTSKEEIREKCQSFIENEFFSSIEWWWIKSWDIYTFYIDGFDERTCHEYTLEDLWIDKNKSEEEIREALQEVYKDFVFQFDCWYFIKKV